MDKKQYTNCPSCGNTLDESGVTYKGKLMSSIKTCKTKDCMMYDWTYGAEQHYQKYLELCKGAK